MQFPRSFKRQALNGPLLFISAFPLYSSSRFLHLPEVIPRLIMVNYIVLPITHFKWAWSFLFHRFSFASYTLGMLENGEEELRIGHYKVKLGSEESEEECAVCLCKIEEGEEISDLRCDHLFHKVCLDRWVQYKRSTCPLCRDSLAPCRAVAELGQEVLVFRFFSFSSGDRNSWWLR